MNRISGQEAASYAGALSSVVASLTLTEIGVIVGITTAVLTFLLNLFYTRRRDKREQAESEARLKKLLGKRGTP
jgi:membrane protein implicated in regulation of membrane protease activity